ncbi:uncharacterized protein LOC126313403 [Schistocerca gregaria]|uniref:uncharacterized protein LOC126313403 n=1 Tax=Schistocerca gregaria TaxID=7010 RepID=UPI00211E6A0D|nr:uncharacterized protein LOC126313403 [Schistocerca gregaria]
MKRVDLPAQKILFSVCRCCQVRMENPWSSEKIRQVFIDFFVKKYEHVFVPSSSVIPNNDPTLLFTNSGMNQFKQIFLGQLDSSSELAGLRRAANSQACIRAGGKHNDLDDVGKDTYHHTFFEMLGNWSFGDYFQEESIEMVVRLMTEVYGIPKENLYATYFEGDEGEGLKPDESARRIWAKYLAEDHILRGDKRDNFWEMGPTGPCGPCSELHYDRLGGRNAADRVNKDDPMVIEVWNIVFIQYNRREDRVLVPLPRRHVDTGMGFERLVSILQNKTSNYDTDVFEDLFRSIQELTGARPYGGRLGAEDEGRVDMAYRILADHARTLTFAISDGCLPGPVGRGYILRRILRRAVRYARECLGAEPGTFARLVPSVVRKMGGFFPKLVQMQERVMEVMEVEERKFAKSLENGLAKFRVMTSGLAPGSLLRGDDVFSLYTAYGFPEDLTRIMAEERGMRVDVEGFERRMREEREEGRRQRKKKLATDALTLSVEACGELNRRGVAKTDDAAKYSLDEVRGQVVAIWDGVVLAEEWSGEGRVGIVLDRTSFYAESGGQKGDVGCIASLESDARFSVDDVQVYGGGGWVREWSARWI